VNAWRTPAWIVGGHPENKVASLAQVAGLFLWHLTQEGEDGDEETKSDIEDDRFVKGKAETFLRLSLSLYESSGSLAAARGSRDIATDLFGLDQCNRAVHYFNQARNLAIQAKDKRTQEESEVGLIEALVCPVDTERTDALSYPNSCKEIEAIKKWLTKFKVDDEQGTFLEAAKIRLAEKDKGCTLASGKKSDAQTTAKSRR